jgi:MarR family transcriptional regulator, organic hydroperoxide resistance regulator
MGNAFAKALKRFGLNLSEWRVCASLLYVPRQSVSELSVHASSDISALSRIVDRLE